MTPKLVTEHSAREFRLIHWAGVVAGGLVVAYGDRDGATVTAKRAFEVAEALEAEFQTVMAGQAGRSR